MKTILTATLILASAIPAFAVRSSIPNDLICISEAKYEEARRFDIVNLRSKEPGAGIPDQSLLDRSWDQKSLHLKFSNECDNMYEVSLDWDQLRALEAGKIRYLRSSLTYYYAGVEIEETDVKLTCFKK